MKKIFPFLGVGVIVVLIIAGIIALGISGMQDNKKWADNNYERYYKAQQKVRAPVAENLAEAKKIMESCVNQFSLDECEKVIEGKIWNGEPEAWAGLTLGVYDDKNTTTVNNLERQQWIYGSVISGFIVYVENGKVSGWQTIGK